MTIEWASLLLWGFVGTVVLTGLMTGAQAVGFTRISLPFILGTMFTPDRDRAKVIGFFVHFLNGWILATPYAAAFEAWQRAEWWLGAGIGFVHAAFVLAAAMPVLPAFHPRMATEEAGPTRLRQLEPPGAFGLHYGWRTPAVVLVAHLLYGVILGAFYRLG